MRLFISYSTGDLDIVKKIANALRPHTEVYYWDKNKVPGQDSWRTIFNWIFLSDLVVAVITDKTVSRGLAVGQEIGHAKAHGKTVIPLVGENVPPTELGCLCGITYIPIKPDNADEIIGKIKERVIATKEMKENQNQIFWVVVAILGLLAVFSKDK